MGSTITQISCGGRHTLAMVPSRGRIYGFGLGGSGQLGICKATNATTPQIVLGPWVPPTQLISSHSDEECVIFRIFSGGDRCFVSVTPLIDNVPPNDFREYSTNAQILRLNVEYIYKCQELTSSCSVDQDMLAYLETVFKSLACLNASCLLRGDEHYGCNSKRHGIDLHSAEHLFSRIAQVENDTIRELVI